MQALLGGHIGYTMDVVAEALKRHRSGKARVIAVAVAGATRAPQLPDVPTLREQGVMKNKALTDRMLALGLEPLGRQESLSLRRSSIRTQSETAVRCHRAGRRSSVEC